MKKDHSLSKKIHLKRSVERINKKINLLGSRCKYNSIHLLNYRLIFSILLFVMSYLFLKPGYLLAPFITVFFYVGSEYFLLDFQIKKREKRLEKEAIFFFEVLTLTIESDNHLKSALEITSANIESDLSFEFRKSLAEIRLGKSFTESMNDMKKRIPSAAINNALLNITQSSIFGNSILESLNNQLEYLREKQILEIKAEISKLPTKISIISVIFFVPILLLIILSPVLLEFLFG